MFLTLVHCLLGLSVLFGFGFTASWYAGLLVRSLFCFSTWLTPLLAFVDSLFSLMLISGPGCLAPCFLGFFASWVLGAMVLGFGSYSLDFLIPVVPRRLGFLVPWFLCLGSESFLF